LLIPFKGLVPTLHSSAYIAPGASIIGDTRIGEDSSVFFGCVLRGDINSISIGRATNVQDLTTVHVASNLGVIIGDEVSIGHGCIIHACTLGNRILVGMGSIIMDGVEIPDNCLIGAGSLLPKGKKYPPGTLILGNPAKVLRSLTPEEVESIPLLAKKYVGVKNQYLIES
jgi:carbonic anhydrase/acetyltransferase-like protein (isoleucine patch superfamily)